MKTAKARFWIEIVALVSSMACVLAVFLALCLAMLGATESSASDQPELGQASSTSLTETVAAHLSYVSEQSVSDQSLSQQSVLAHPISNQASQTQASPDQASPTEPQAYEGIITDTRCGAKHSAKIALSAADCTRVCVHSGDGFALVDGDKLYLLQGEAAALKQSAGERVKILGTLTGNTIAVSSVIKL
jgi:hypothetical protein